MLRVANETSLSALRLEARVASTAVAHIAAYREGKDRKEGTADDQVFATPKQLDDVPYVGPVALKRLLAYAKLKGYVGEDPVTPPEPPTGSMVITKDTPLCGAVYCGNLWKA